MLDMISYYIIGALGFIVAFGLAVFIHELGHFLAAKAFKVPVERFVIGFDREAMAFMPRCIWERKIGETVYGLSIVPLGGYVKMSGSVHPDLEAFFDEGPKNDPNNQEPESLVNQAIGDQAALYKKPFWQKTIIFAAGVFMNIMLAMGIIAFISWYGITTNAPLPTVVGWQKADSPFLLAGIQQGDRLTSLNGTAISTDEDFYVALDSIYPKDLPANAETLPLKMELALKRDDATTTKTVEFDGIKNGLDLSCLIASPAYVDYVMLNQPAIKAGIREGDLITRIGDEAIDDRGEATVILRESVGITLEVEVLGKEGEKRVLSMTPKPNPDEKIKQGMIGISFGNSEKIIERSSVGEALMLAPQRTYFQVERYVLNLKKLGGKLLEGNIQSIRENLGGPVAITQQAGYHANLGFERFLQFLIALNVALAVMNILPIPLLDGGHIVLAAYEGVFGKPVPARVLVPILNGAIYLLLGFVVLVSLSDVLKLFR